MNYHVTMDNVSPKKISVMENMIVLMGQMSQMGANNKVYQQNEVNDTKRNRMEYGNILSFTRWKSK